MRLLTRAEEFVLLAIWKLQDNAYSLPIRKQISEITGHAWSLGSIYTPLERLVKKGLLTSYLTESSPERGGRHKRVYQLTRPGRQALIRIHERASVRSFASRDGFTAGDCWDLFCKRQ